MTFTELFSIYLVITFYCLITMETLENMTEKMENRFLFWFLVLTPIVQLFVLYMNKKWIKKFLKDKK